MRDGSSEPIYVTKPIFPDLEVIKKRLDVIWESGMLTNVGVQHRELERDLCRYLGCENISLFNNGTTALTAGLKALDLEGEVITTPFTFPATVQALEWNGLKPVFCDIDPVTMTIDAGKIESLIGDDTSAILGVHVFDNICDLERIEEIAGRHDLRVIYDSAHSFGSTYKGRPIWQYGDICMFSFHATKLFNTIEGGCIIARDSRVTDRLETMKSFGRNSQGKVVDWGINGKMNEVQAAMGLEVLKLVDLEKEKRMEVDKIYRSFLQDAEGIRILTETGAKRSCQFFVVEIIEEIFGRSRDQVCRDLNSINIFPRKYFHPLCSDTDWYRMDYGKDELTNARRAAESVLALPFYGSLAGQDVEIICRTILDRK